MKFHGITMTAEDLDFLKGLPRNLFHSQAWSQVYDYVKAKSDPEIPMMEHSMRISRLSYYYDHYIRGKK